MASMKRILRSVGIGRRSTDDALREFAQAHPDYRRPKRGCPWCGGTAVSEHTIICRRPR